jgi:hypothetical protein
MSQLQSIASRLRGLAQDATPLSANVEASARQLKALGQQVESLARSGVDVGPLVAALRAAEAQALAASHAASQVKEEGVAWADDLAAGAGAAQDVMAGGLAARLWGSLTGNSPGARGERTSLPDQRRGETEWVPGSGDDVPAALRQVAAQDPPEGWASLINEPGMANPGRNNNCVDCARSVESTWRGSPARSAALADADGMGTSSSRVTDWTGGELQPTTYSEIAQVLADLGPGSSAIIVSSRRRGGHAYNAVNDDGTIKFIDGQTTTVSGWPPSSWRETDWTASWAVFLGPDGQPHRK